MFNIAVCDDEICEVKRIAAFLEEYQKEKKEQFEVKTFQNPNDLIEYVEKHGGFDVYFLDVLMDGLKGTDAAKEIRQKETHSEIIFITSSKEYAIDAFELNATHYLIKPATKERLYDALDRALEKLKEKGDKFLVRNTSDGVLRINLNTFVYSEASGHYQFVHLQNGDEIKIRSKTSELWEELKQYPNFLQPHSGYIVNMDFIKNITSYGVNVGTFDLPISKNTFNIVKKTYLDYTFNKE